jgi:hypothetical protein
VLRTNGKTVKGGKSGKDIELVVAMDPPWRLCLDRYVGGSLLHADDIGQRPLGSRMHDSGQCQRKHGCIPAGRNPLHS